MKFRSIIAVLTFSLLSLSQVTAQMQFQPAIGPPPAFTPPSGPTRSQFEPLRAPEPPPGWRTGTVAKSSSTSNTELKRMRALLVIDSNSNLTTCTLRSLATMRGLLTSGIPADRLDLTVLEGDQATPQRVFDYYQNLNTGADETVLFYYAGHGGMDKARKFIDGSQGHFLAMKAGALYRSDLFKVIKAKKPGLTVVLTDCCSSEVGGNAENADSDTVLSDDSARPQQLSHLCRCLFFQHRGIVDYTAALPGTVAYTDPQIGGWFTATVARMFAAPQNSFPDGGRGFVSWDTVDNVIVFRTLDLLKERRSTVVQVPFRFIHGAP